VSVEIIAELAQGFEGRPEQARMLLKAAAAAGADAAKFQLVYADELATPDYKYYDLFQSLEMPDEVWMGLAAYALDLGIKLQLDIFGMRSLNLATKIGVSTVKLHGTDISNLGLLNQVANSSVKKVLLGAGGAHLSELERAISVLSAKDLVIILGFQGYPTPNNSNQISRVQLFTQRFVAMHPNLRIGFADHASPNSPLRYSLAAMAIGAGAKVVEKHLTLSRLMKLEDHESALNVEEFLEFTETVRGCMLAFGFAADVENFDMSESECAYRKMIRRHVVASRNLEIGEEISPSDLILKRTSAGQAITDLSLVYQKTVKQAVSINSPILPKDIS
jgi:N,N'-diacetyllegionaminate synthase